MRSLRRAKTGLGDSRSKGNVLRGLDWSCCGSTLAFCSFCKSSPDFSEEEMHFLHEGMVKSLGKEQIHK